MVLTGSVPATRTRHSTTVSACATTAPSLACCALRRRISPRFADEPVLRDVEGLDLALDERSGEFFGHSAAMKSIKRDARRLASHPF